LDPLASVFLLSSRLGSVFLLSSRLGKYLKGCDDFDGDLRFVDRHHDLNSISVNVLSYCPPKQVVLLLVQDDLTIHQCELDIMGSAPIVGYSLDRMLRPYKPNRWIPSNST
jgi:hypothetical protein